MKFIPTVVVLTYLSTTIWFFVTLCDQIMTIFYDLKKKNIIITAHERRKKHWQTKHVGRGNVIFS